MSIGSIVPVLVDSYSSKPQNIQNEDDGGEGQGGEAQHYAYRNFLYCDGSQYEIREYPNLYEVIRNNYVLSSERVENNAIRSNVSGTPGTVYRTFVDNGNLYAEIYGREVTDSNGNTIYERVVPNNAVLYFDTLNDYPTANGQIEERTPYILEYTAAYQTLRSSIEFYVYRILVNYDPDGGTGGTQASTASWTITSSSLINTGDEYLQLPIANYGTVPLLDPGTFDPLTGTGYPTGYDQYPSAENDTPAFSWSNLSGLPDGVTVDTYEILIEDLSTDVFKHWHVTNIPSTFTSIAVNQSFPAGSLLQQNSVESSSIGSAPGWVNNGYSGPQPPLGEQHLYRFYVKAVLSDSQILVTHVDFTAGSGGLVPRFFRDPLLEDNLDIVGGSSNVTTTDLNVWIGNLVNQPMIRIRKSFSLRDYPYLLGKFRVPDYRDRKLIGYGEGVNGSGTPIVEDATTINVGDSGGRWYITTDIIENPQEFYEISDVITTGYSDVTTLIQPYLTGQKKYVVGPIQDYIYARPPLHTHNILCSEPDEGTDAVVPGSDVFTTGYIRIKGSVEDFQPNADFEQLGHSHGLLGYRPLSPKTATLGNVDGIGLKEDAGGGCFNYNITEPGAVLLSSASANGSQITITFSQNHSFAVGNIIIVQGATGGLDGTYEVIAEGLTGTTLRAATTKNGSSASGTVRIASGYFEETLVTPDPKVWVVDNNTVIGGKDITIQEPGTGELRFENEYTSGSANIASNAGGTNVTSYIVALAGGGGGGGGSTGSGSNGGTTSVTLTVDGVAYTIYAYGGQGGTSGSSGGAGGDGGTYSIPAELFNDPRFDWSLTANGQDGSDGGGSNGATPNGGAAQLNTESGGSGGFNTTTVSGSISSPTYTSNGSYNPSSAPGVQGGTNIEYVDFDMSGGAGGNGPPNGQAGCSTTGGSGSPGRRVTGRINGSYPMSFIIGRRGGTGQNIHAGSTGESTTPGGSGAANGGQGGAGAWGNGGSGGGGGGASSLSIPAGNIAGAGGGGGGGGTGGGDNNGSAPGGVIDPCWTGGSGLGPTSSLYAGGTIGFSTGGAGGSKGCTSGGGGGGGGGAGPAGGGNGGTGGNAGAGHVNTGSGSGGNAGRSAVNTTYVSNYSESSGSSGDGYIRFTISTSTQVTNASGGGGGAGAAISFKYFGSGIETAWAISVGGGGNNGSGGGGDGGAGYVVVRAYGTIPGDEPVVGITEASGRVWDVPGFPDSYSITGLPSTIGGAIWHSSSEGVEVQGHVGDNFSSASSITSGLSNRYIRFSGNNTSRFLQIGPLNLQNAEEIVFGVIKGNGSNGGDPPEESLNLYLRNSLDSPTESLVQAIATPTVSSALWNNYSIELDPESDVRASSSVYLVIRQTRPEGSGDNDDVPGGTTNDNWGLALFGVRYGQFTQRIFVPTLNATLPGNTGTCGPDDGIDVVRRTVTAADTNIRFTDGTLNLSTSTPISVTGTARVQEILPLTTKYHRCRYLIKAS